MDTKPVIDKTGITVQTFNEIHTELSDGYKEIYGDDIDLDQNTPDGQKIGIEAKAILDLQSFALALYNFIDPDFATGDQLNRIIKYCGIRRKPPTRSSAPVTIDVAYNTTLPKGYIVRDTNNQNWITVSEYSLSVGENHITMYAQNWGKIDASADTINRPVTVILGVRSVTNTSAASPGSDEETDEELRIRRNLSLENAAYSTVGNLYSRLADIPGVTDLLIYENNTASYDSILNLNPHSIWIIIDGGDTAQIAETIARYKTGGTGLKGTESGTWIEEVLRPDGSSFYYTHVMQWDHSLNVPLYVRLNVKRKQSDIPIIISAIKNAITSLAFNIAESIVVTEFYRYIYEAGSTFTASSLEFSRDGVNWINDIVPVGSSERFSVPADNITIEEI